MSDADDWADDLRRERIQKDEFLAEHPRSPLPAGERAGFDGLSYYPPDETYRFEVTLEEFDEQDVQRVETTAAGERPYRRWGEFRFALAGAERRLTAYRSGEEERLWVPFTDETNGETTYGGGRYLDLAPADRTDDGEWTLDLNDAYNPFCVFSDDYECALVPPENHLDVRVEAGERIDG